jgi:hypothetical protein
MRSQFYSIIKSQTQGIIVTREKRRERKKVVGGLKKHMVSRKAKVGIVVVVVIIVVGLIAAAAYYYYSSSSFSRQNNTAAIFTAAGAPSEQEIQTQIAQASPNPNMDTTWNDKLNACMNVHRLGGSSLLESDCDSRTITEDRDYDCRIWNGELLLCDPNSTLGKKFRSYLNVIV